MTWEASYTWVQAANRRPRPRAVVRSPEGRTRVCRHRHVTEAGALRCAQAWAARLEEEARQ